MVCSGLREPLRKGCGSLAEELILDGTFSPHHICILLGTTDKLRFSAVPCLSTVKGSECSAALVPLPLNSPASALLSPKVYTHQYCSQPSPKLSYLAHKPHFRMDTAGAGTTWS